MTSGELYLGAHRETGAPLVLPAQTLLRHAMALGSSGSGKTVFCKVVVEELVRSGIPTICVDPQGDLCSLVSGALSDEELRDKGVDPALAREFAERADVVIFTPASEKGVPLCADPVDPGLADLPEGERLGALTRTASMVTALLGFDVESDDGSGLIAVLDRVLTELLAAGGRPSLASLTEELTTRAEKGLGELERYLDARKIRTACQRLARLDVGARRLLFHRGVPIDIDVLLGRDDAEGRTRVSVIYLNTLSSQEDKDFLVAALADRLYAWMLAHPSREPQLLFYIDEVSPFIPPVRKPACKDGLSLLFKQARKYGVCCLMATQNPGDVDYRAMAQFGTWALGRLTTRQDLKKIEPTIKSLEPVGADAVLGSLPSLKPGELTLLSPDCFPGATPLKVRYLFGEHATFDEERIEQVADQRWRQRFETNRPSAEPSARPARPATGTTERSGTHPRAAPEAESTTGQSSKSTSVPEARPAKATPPPAPASEPAPSRESSTAARRAPSGVAPTVIMPAPDPRDAERDALLTTLTRQESLAVRELSTQLSLSEKKVRALLKKLEEQGVVGSFKKGRATRYYARASGARPDLGLPGRLLAVIPRIDQNTATSLANDQARRRFLGLLGDDEALASLRLVHRLLYKLDFREQVRRSLLGRLVGGDSDERLGSVYVHPHSLELLWLDPRAGIGFSGAPDAEHAGDISDLDGVAHFAEVTPAQLVIDEREWTTRSSLEQVQAAFAQRYSAHTERITPLFFPLWELTFRQDGGARFRVVLLDALLGQPVVWPRTQ